MPVESYMVTDYSQRPWLDLTVYDGDVLVVHEPLRRIPLERFVRIARRRG